MTPNAIPATAYRQPRNSQIAYRYVTDAEAMRLAVDDMERQLKIERKVLWWAVSNGRRLVAAKQRSWIDYAETARRNGLAKLRQLEAA
jgi:hypothetical protein